MINYIACFFIVQNIVVWMDRLSWAGGYEGIGLSGVGDIYFGLGNLS